MSKEPHHVIIAPILSEESTIQTETQNKYMFKVHPNVNKIEIRNAIMKLYPQIKVLSVNTMNYTGKVRRRGRGRPGRRPNWKKAVVSLRKGDTIEVI